MKTRRLTSTDRDLARQTFAMMAEVFESEGAPLGDEYLERLLGREDFWAIAALEGEEPVGGLTAYALLMTRAESRELFIYDVAVRADRQRRGVGRALMHTLREGAQRAGIDVLFVPADDEDTHALDFYRALGGKGAAVTIFEWSGERG